MMKEKEYRFEKTFPISREKTWDLLADTEHVTRASGMFPAEFSAVQQESYIYRKATGKYKKLISLKWHELPYEWVRNYRRSNERKYIKGPIDSLQWQVKLEDIKLADGSIGTKMNGIATFRYHNFLAEIAIPFVALPPIKNIMNYLSDYLSVNKNSETERLPSEHNDKAIELVHLERLCKELKKLHPYTKQIQQLYDLIAYGGEDQIRQMQAYVLAEKWKEDKQEVLIMFLHAVKLGILKQSWNLMCPNCRVSKSMVSSLKEVKNEVHCDMCGIQYDMDFSKYVEMRFTVHPSIRIVTTRTHCIGGPANFPHISAQYRVPANTAQEIEYLSSEGNERIRILGVNHTVDIIRDEQKPGIELHYNPSGFSSTFCTFHPEGGKLSFKNQSEKEIIVVIEKQLWNDDAVTAADVTSLQLFRDLFANEVLAADQQIGVENITVLFSDLQGSTHFTIRWEMQKHIKKYMIILII